MRVRSDSCAFLVYTRLSWPQRAGSKPLSGAHRTGFGLEAEAIDQAARARQGVSDNGVAGVPGDDRGLGIGDASIPRPAPAEAWRKV